MSNNPTGLIHVSDTALLVAACRAVEADNPFALVRDQFAASLAGNRGMEMFRALPHPQIMGFGLALRTRFLDDLIQQTIASAGLKTVLCVGAGLDTRPWRLNLPRELRWLEIDFPDMLDFKEKLLQNDKPICRRERLAADINDPIQRARVLAAAGTEPALMITEGLLMYLPAATVRNLANEAGRETAIQHWMTDITTDSFSKALGGGGGWSRTIKPLQAEDHLNGEQILETIHAAGWRVAAHRSYIRDVDFAADRIKHLMGGAEKPPGPSPFSPTEPAGVFDFTRR